MKALSVNQLSKSFLVKRSFFSFSSRTKKIVSDLSFELESGQITGFLGANGSGKTTTMKCILGLLRADAGEVQVFGGSVAKASQNGQIGFLPENPYFYDYLTGREFLSFYLSLSKRWKPREIHNQVSLFLDKVELADAAEKSLRSYSKGMLQRIGLVQAVIHAPKLIVLDEPMSGLDPRGRQIVKEMIRETVNQGSSVFLSSHLLHDVEELCSDIILLKEGRSLFTGSLENLLLKEQCSYSLRFRLGEKKEEVILPSIKAANEKIFQLINKKGEILELKKIKKSLEEVYSILSETKEFENV